MRQSIVFLAITILSVGLTLRAPILSVAPLIQAIKADTGLSSGAAGMLTTIPVLCFGLVSPLAPWLARRFGMEQTFLGALVLCIIGIALRSTPQMVLLFSGTIFIGSGIAINMVLLPGFVKREAPHNVGPMTAVFSGAISAGAAMGAGVTLPVQERFQLGWRATLTWPVVICLIALATMLPWALRARRRRLAAPAKSSSGSVLRSSLAWNVTMYLATQSWWFYAITAWLPTYLVAHGMEPVHAGSILAVHPLLGMVGSFSAPLLLNRFSNPRLLIMISSTLGVIGMVGTLVFPTTLIVLWVMTMGLGSGMMLSLAMAFIGLGARDAGHAAALSSMAQSIGFGLAATGPFLSGLVADQTGSWTIPFVIMLLTLIPITISGLLSARDVVRHIGEMAAMPPVESVLSGRSQSEG